MEGCVLTALWFYVPLDTKYVISETFPCQSFGLTWKETKLNTTKARIHQSKETYYSTK